MNVEAVLSRRQSNYVNLNEHSLCARWLRESNIWRSERDTSLLILMKNREAQDYSLRTSKHFIW